MFAVVAVFGEVLSVKGDSVAGSPTFTFSTSVLVAAAALFGPAPAGIIAFVVLVLVDFVRGDAAVKFLFNAAAYGIAGVWAAVAFDAVKLTSEVDVRMLLALAALVVVHLAVQVVLIGSVVGSTRGASPIASIAGYASTAVAPQVTEYSLAVVLAQLAITAPLFAPLLLPLLVAIYRAHARSSALRRETDMALRHLADIVDERDPSTFDHSHRVGELVRDLTRSLKLSERDVETLSRAGRLHDLGKVMVDRSILQKPGALDEDEFAQVRLHPAVSARLLGTFGFAREEARAVELHHERFDGHGYYGVPVEDIPLSAHCLILADAWDAMTSDRPYRPGMSEAVAAERVEEALGTQFHPVLGRVFLAIQAGKRPEDVIDAVQLSSLRRGLATGRRTAYIPALRKAWTVTAPRAVRLGFALSFALTALAPIARAHAAAIVGSAAALAVGSAMLGVRRRVILRRLLAEIDALNASATLSSIVSILDPHVGVSWAGGVIADRASSLSRAGEAWRSPVAPPRLEHALDGCLARIASRLRPGDRWDGEVEDRAVVLIARADGWLGLATDRPLPGRVADAIEAQQQASDPLAFPEMLVDELHEAAA
jgi:HD-GYP domain-containing protein (c-di-GMP phosphodiesterase class II)